LDAEDVTIDDILAEIAAYIVPPDYYAEGWRTTLQIFEAALELEEGLTMEAVRKRLERDYKRGKLEKFVDESRCAWWRVKRV
jgi:hypothetical protein